MLLPITIVWEKTTSTGIPLQVMTPMDSSDWSKLIHQIQGIQGGEFQHSQLVKPALNKVSKSVKHYLFDSFHSTFKCWVIVPQLNFRSKREEANSNQEHVTTLFFCKVIWRSTVRWTGQKLSSQITLYLFKKVLLLACLVLTVKLALYYKILLLAFFGISQPNWRTPMILNIIIRIILYLFCQSAVLASLSLILFVYKITTCLVQ